MLELQREAGARPHVKGHRGAMAYAPENTMPSFELAHEMGADEIELDVQRSKDGQLVVIHDQAVERTTDGRGHVWELTFQELRALDAGSPFDARFRGARIPTLEEVLSWARGKVAVAVEIKNCPYFYDGIEEQVLDCIVRAGMHQGVMVTSFDHPSLGRIKEMSLGLATGILFSCRPANAVELARQTGADAILPHWTFVTRDMVDHAHREGLGVNPWAVNCDEAVAQMIERKVDTLTSNFPDRARQLVLERYPEP